MISYLHGYPWTYWSREERLFCAVLYEHARKEPAAFANWVIREACIDVPPANEWELGFEVCFYRDYLWHLKRQARQGSFSQKRTFDLCLFSEESIVVLEAKVCEPFDPSQNEEFRRDEEALKSVLGKPKLHVKTVALASSKYFANARRFGHPGTLDVFDGRFLTWNAVAERYPDPLLARADSMYKLRPGDFLREGKLGHSY